MKKSILVFFLFCWSYSSAQNEYVNWYFGQSIGLNFCNGLHISQVNQFSNTYAASATFSDKTTGQMLLHTDGETVWNSQYQIMQNGSGLKGSNGSAQGALIVPEPGNDSIYYIFTTGSQGINPQDGLEYSIVNMHLNGGLGAVISVNNFLHKSLEKLTAVFNKTGNYYRILAVDSASDNFLEYKLDSLGLNTVPVLYPTNVIFSDLYMSSGFLKVSPDVNLLACTFELPDTAALYNFNNTTGEITFITKLQFLVDDDDVWGISFSPNSSKLYVSMSNDTMLSSNNYQGYDKIYQFDVTSVNPLAINNSRVKIYSFNFTNNGHVFGALQLGPDRKLYIARIEPDSLTVIDEPDSAGLACDFRFNAIFLDNLISTVGLSNNIDDLYEWAQPPSLLSITTNSPGCNGIGNFTIIASKNYNGYEVSFGDGADTVLDSLQFTSTHKYNLAGNYTVTLKGRLGCVYDSVSTTISIPSPCVNPLIIPNLINTGSSQTQWSILNLPSNTAVTIYDELGKTLYKTTNYLNNYDMRNLPPAMYFYRLDLQDGEELKGKIVLVK